MLQDYHRQITIKPFAPILKDRSKKRWDSEISLPTNISLLSISNSSIHSDDDENKIEFNQDSSDTDSSSSQESFSVVNESQELKKKTTSFDQYILNKHLNAIPSTISNIEKEVIDPDVLELFDESKFVYRLDDEECNPRSIRPPSFTQYIKQVQESRTKAKPVERRSARILVRTNKAEQLKLARQKSACLNISQMPYLRPYTTKTQATLSAKSRTQSAAIPSHNYISLSQIQNTTNFRQSESARSCRIAIGSNDPLHPSSMLIRQMRQDIQCNRVPSYSKPLNSSLLREQPYPPLNNQYKMKRINEWLKHIASSSDYIEYNENASNETVRGTNFNDRIDLEPSDIMSDEKQLNNIERTFDEAHRILPLFKTAINRQMKQRNLLLTRIELDLYVV